MDAWDATDVFEFFMGVTVHEEHIVRQLKDIENKQRNARGRNHPAQARRR